MFHRALQCSLLLVLVLPVCIGAQGGAPTAAMPAAVEAKTLVWTDLALPGFAPGLKLAGIQGDANVANQPYTIRLKFPAGYTFPAHYHPNAENLTVLSGTFLLGHGAKADSAGLKTYAPGDFLFIPPKSPHYGQVKGETVVQLHGVGPFEVILAK